jgi:hypothetical protein
MLMPFKPIVARKNENFACSADFRSKVWDVNRHGAGKQDINNLKDKYHEEKWTKRETNELPKSDNSVLSELGDSELTQGLALVLNSKILYLLYL